MNWDNDLDDYEIEDPNETFLIPCSNCKAEVYEDCEQCPHCGEYIIRSTNPLIGKPDWYIWLAVLGIIATIFGMLFAF
ncbi:hypothetical protein N9153_02910 [Planctomicrobium sp.]|jgi:hypothetical protein|nr:hypothetical protein [Planctomicrobium sp.]MDB4439855.1 hypothetical protein [Planctomicrobium sp.]